MKLFATLVVFLSVSTSAFSADTASVISCYNQAYSQSGLNMTQEAAAILCSKVNSLSDVSAVINCYNQAYPEGGLNMTQETAATLCSNVTK